MMVVVMMTILVMMTTLVMMMKVMMTKVMMTMKDSGLKHLLLVIQTIQVNASIVILLLANVVLI
jgi:hypothetical protein